MTKSLRIADRQSSDYLTVLLKNASDIVPEGVYRHYKGDLYQVTDHALGESELEVVVVYVSVTTGVKFTRPISEWNQVVDSEGTQRFSPVNITGSVDSSDLFPNKGEW